MATAPYFVISPSAILSAVGLLRGADKTEPTPAEDWRQATVDVVIPALNEERGIVLCLASVMRQTLKPERIILVDDGSQDSTLEYARRFCDANGVELIGIHRKAPIGKTPTIKRQAREFSSDVEFILDGDTVLESDDYIERTVQELYAGVGVASACGLITPFRNKDRVKLLEHESVERFLDGTRDARVHEDRGLFYRINWGITNFYRSVLYMFLQRFVYRGQMVFFGTISNPVGCAVAYRRKYIKDLFDHYEPILGDDLTNSEDIFIGFALLSEGYRNVQVGDVVARSREPQSHRLPRQVYMWSSSFLQSCFYFDTLLRSPFKALKRRRQERRSWKDGVAERRKIQEPYRQPFGREYTNKFGRPVGWVLLMGAIEKVGFPTALLMMSILRMWEPLLVTVAAETILSLLILMIIAKGERLKYLLKGILVTPLRYLTLLYDLVTILRFGVDVWVRREKKWRK